MISKETVKHLKQLQEKKYRREFNEFTVEGVKGVSEALESKMTVALIVIDGKLRDRDDMREIIKLADSLEVATEFCGRLDIDNIKTTETFPGVIAIVETPDYGSVDLADNSPIIALSGLKDPGNLGTIIRTADWFGIKNIILGEDTVEPYNPKVVRSTMGSLFRVKIFESNNIVQTISNLKDKQNYAVVALDMAGKNLTEMKSPKKTIYIFGNESHGLEPKLDNLITERYTIPGRGGAESLNVAVAAGITMSRIMSD
ncbi:MAG: RNA methyltransferase [Patescibacteria group bacterium]